MKKAAKKAKAPAGKASSGSKPANKVSPSPRRLNAAEKAYAEIKAQKSKFRSDKKVREEMQRRGFLKGPDPQGQLIMIASRARKKKGSPY
jgi:hypothetical protein